MGIWSNTELRDLEPIVRVYVNFSVPVYEGYVCPDSFSQATHQHALSIFLYVSSHAYAVRDESKSAAVTAGKCSAAPCTSNPQTPHLTLNPIPETLNPKP